MMLKLILCVQGAILGRYRAVIRFSTYFWVWSPWNIIYHWLYYVSCACIRLCLCSWLASIECLTIFLYMLCVSFAMDQGLIGVNLGLQIVNDLTFVGAGLLDGWHMYFEQLSSPYASDFDDALCPLSLVWSMCFSSSLSVSEDETLLVISLLVQIICQAEHLQNAPDFWVALITRHFNVILATYVPFVQV